MTIQVNDVEFMFVRYGFLGCPLTRKQIVSLLCRGIDHDRIYSIGCDIAAR